MTTGLSPAPRAQCSLNPLPGLEFARNMSTSSGGTLVKTVWSGLLLSERSRVRSERNTLSGNSSKTQASQVPSPLPQTTVHAHSAAGPHVFLLTLVYKDHVEGDLRPKLHAFKTSINTGDTEHSWGHPSLNNMV